MIFPSAFAMLGRRTTATRLEETLPCNCSK
jgi:hypothetical protein